MNRRAPICALLLVALACGPSDPRARGPSAEGSLDVSLAGLDADVVARVEEARAKVREFPRYEANWGALGLVFLANGLPAPALDAFREANQVDPEDAKWWYFQARALQETGAQEAAYAALEQATRFDPDNAQPFVLRGTCLLAEGRLGDARAAFDRALELDARDPWAWAGRGRVALQEDALEQALADLQQAYRRASFSAEIQNLLGTALLRSGERERARSYLNSSNAVLTRSPHHAWEIELLQQRAETRDVVWARALASHERGRSAEALELLAPLLRETPRDLNLLHVMATIHAATGEYARAQRLLERCLAIEPQKREALVTLAGVLAEQGRVPLALQTIERAVEAHPGFGEAHRYHALILERARDAEGAVAAYRRALACDERELEVRVDFGNLLLRRGAWAEALEVLEGARERGLTTGDLFVALAQARLEAGDPLGAETAWAEAERLGPSNQRQYERVKRLFAQRLKSAQSTSTGSDGDG